MQSISIQEFNYHFKVLDRLGEGGYGTVFKIIDRETKKFFAFKTIRCPTLNNLSSAMQEILSRINVQSKFIIKNYFYLFDKKLEEVLPNNFKEIYMLGIIMEYAECSLYEQMKERRKQKFPFKREEIYKMLENFVNLFAYMQEKSIAHRDIKPENILCTCEGFKLSDFGLAKLCRDSKSKSYAGSPLYVSPKLREAHDKKNYANLEHDIFKSDVFSLGLNILEAATLGNVAGLNNRNSGEKLKYFISMLTKKEEMKGDTIIDSNRYDDWFRRVLESMLEINEKSRPDFIELRKILSEGRENLLETKNPFLMDTQFQEDMVTSYINRNFYKKTNENEMSFIQYDNDAFEEEEETTELIFHAREKRLPNFNLENIDEVSYQSSCATGIPSSEKKTKYKINSKSEQLLSFCKFSRNGTIFIVTVGYRIIEMFTPLDDQGKFLQLYSSNYDLYRFNAIINFSFSENSELFLALGTSNKSILFFYFDDSTTQLIQLNEVHNIHCKAISSLAFIKKRNVIISGSSDFTIRLGRVSLKKNEMSCKINKSNIILDYQPQITLVGHVDAISTINYNDENDLVISGGNEGVIFVWDATTGKEKYSYKAHTNWVCSLKFFRLGINHKIVSGGADGKICLYDINSTSYNKVQLYQEGETPEWISYVDYLENDRYILICQVKRVIILNAYNLNAVYQINNDGMAIHGAFQLKVNDQNGIVFIHSNGLTYSILN